MNLLNPANVASPLSPANPLHPLHQTNNIETMHHDKEEQKRYYGVPEGEYTYRKHSISRNKSVFIKQGSIIVFSYHNNDDLILGYLEPTSSPISKEEKQP